MMPIAIAVCLTLTLILAVKQNENERIWAVSTGPGERRMQNWFLNAGTEAKLNTATSGNASSDVLEWLQSHAGTSLKVKCYDSEGASSNHGGWVVAQPEVHSFQGVRQSVPVWRFTVNGNHRIELSANTYQEALITPDKVICRLGWVTMWIRPGEQCGIYPARNQKEADYWQTYVLEVVSG